jgi:hypothetical protein
MLIVESSISKSWKHFEIDFCYHAARHSIAVAHPREVSRGVKRVAFDTASLQGNPVLIPLSDDDETHRVRLILGEVSQIEELRFWRQAATAQPVSR